MLLNIYICNNHISEHYLQTFPYDILEPCCIFPADSIWLGVGKPPSARNMLILQLLGGGGDILNA